MNKKIEAMRDSIRELSGGHSLESFSGDYLWQTREAINITKLLEAAEAVREEQEGGEWECFCDASYYDKWAVRHTGDRSFNAVIHVNTKEEAEFLVERLSEADLLRKENKILKDLLDNG